MCFFRETGVEVRQSDVLTFEREQRQLAPGGSPQALANFHRVRFWCDLRLAQRRRKTVDHPACRILNVRRGDPRHNRENDAAYSHEEWECGRLESKMAPGRLEQNDDQELVEHVDRI